MMSHEETECTDLTLDSQVRYFLDILKHPEILQEFLELVLTCYTSIKPSTTTNFGKLENLNNQTFKEWAGYLPSFDVNFRVSFKRKAQIVIEVHKTNRPNIDKSTDSNAVDSSCNCQNVEQESSISQSANMPENKNCSPSGQVEPKIYITFYPGYLNPKLEGFNSPTIKLFNPIVFDTVFEPVAKQSFEIALHLEARFVYISYTRDLDASLDENVIVLNNWFKVIFRPYNVDHKLLSENQQKFLDTFKLTNESGVSTDLTDFSALESSILTDSPALE